MVLDRNDKEDYNDVVKVLMIGEVEAHYKASDGMENNILQVSRR